MTVNETATTPSYVWTRRQNTATWVCWHDASLAAWLAALRSTEACQHAVHLFDDVFEVQYVGQDPMKLQAVVAAMPPEN